MNTRFVDVPASPHGRASRLAVHLAGSGPLAVLLHGYPFDHRMWLDTLHGPLARHRTLAALDLRGRGASSPSIDAVHTMELLASDAAAVIRSLTDGAADVIGLSMGGYAAFALWQQAPKLVSTLVLANTRPVADSPEARAGRDNSIATVVEQGRRALASAMVPKVLAASECAWLRARVFAMIEDTPTETIVADLRGLKDRPDRQAMLPSIAAPVLVVTGELDAIATPAESTAMANAIPRARCEVLRGAAHLTPMEVPSEFAQAVGAFWSR